jgi:hypothetical protein
VALALLDHAGHEGPDAVGHAEEVHLHDPAPAVGGDRPGHAAHPDARVVAQDVGGAEALERGGRQGLHRVLGGARRWGRPAPVSAPSRRERLAAPSSGSRSTSASTTFIPSRPNRVTSPRPMPDAAPRDDRDLSLSRTSITLPTISQNGHDGQAAAEPLAGRLGPLAQHRPPGRASRGRPGRPAWARNDSTPRSRLRSRPPRGWAAARRSRPVADAAPRVEAGVAQVRKTQRLAASRTASMVACPHTRWSAMFRNVPPKVSRWLTATTTSGRWRRMAAAMSRRSSSRTGACRRRGRGTRPRPRPHRGAGPLLVLRDPRRPRPAPCRRCPPRPW